MSFRSGGISKQPAGLSHQAAAMVFPLERVYLKTAADIRDAIVSGQGRIQHGEIRVDEVRDTQVPGHDMMNELNGLLFEEVLRLFREVEILRVNCQPSNAGQVQPLSSKVFRETPLRRSTIAAA